MSNTPTAARKPITFPVYRNAKGNDYSCGTDLEDGKASAFQIKNGKRIGPHRAIDFSDLDFVGTVTLEEYTWKPISNTIA